MMRTPEEQYLHELIESYVAPLRSEIKELRQQLNTELVKNNGVLPVVRVMLPDNAVPHDIAKEFTDTKLKVVNTLLSDDYKTGYREGITHFIEAKGN